MESEYTQKLSASLFDPTPHLQKKWTASFIFFFLNEKKHFPYILMKAIQGPHSVYLKYMESNLTRTYLPQIKEGFTM